MNIIDFNNAIFERSYGEASQLYASDMPEIVFAGRSNVGKSTLLNRLFNRKALARVSSQPGKTATVNFYRCGNVRFADLPGYGYAKISGSEKKRWANLLEEYFRSGRDIRLVALLLDIRHAPSDDDMQMIAFLRSMSYPFLIVFTKCDKLNKTGLEERRAGFKEELAFLRSIKTIEFSIKDSRSTDVLKEEIIKYI